MLEAEVIIDFEFTGLDNTFIKDNEIIQVKAYNLTTDKCITKNFHSKKKVSAYGLVMHKLRKFSYREGPKFNVAQFNLILSYIGVKESDRILFYGFGPAQDMLMLKKYGINTLITDIREWLQCSRHEYRLATEGNNLESCYYIVTGKHPQLSNHNGIAELYVMVELFRTAKRLRKKEFLSVMPFGHCAGMPLKDYVANYRRNADGYRYNNKDILARSLDFIIEELEGSWEDDEDWNDDDN